MKQVIYGRGRSQFLLLYDLRGAVYHKGEVVSWPEYSIAVHPHYWEVCYVDEDRDSHYFGGNQKGFLNWEWI